MRAWPPNRGKWRMTPNTMWMTSTRRKPLVESRERWDDWTFMVEKPFLVGFSSANLSQICTILIYDQHAGWHYDEWSLADTSLGEQYCQTYSEKHSRHEAQNSWTIVATCSAPLAVESMIPESRQDMTRPCIIHEHTANGVCVYIYIWHPNDPCFDYKRPGFWGCNTMWQKGEVFCRDHIFFIPGGENDKKDRQQQFPCHDQGPPAEVSGVWDLVRLVLHPLPVGLSMKWCLEHFGIGYIFYVFIIHVSLLMNGACLWWHASSCINLFNRAACVEEQTRDAVHIFTNLDGEKLSFNEVEVSKLKRKEIKSKL